MNQIQDAVQNPRLRIIGSTADKQAATTPADAPLHAQFQVECMRMHQAEVRRLQLEKQNV